MSQNAGRPKTFRLPAVVFFAATILVTGIARAADEGCMLNLGFDEKSGVACKDLSGSGNDAQILAGKRVGDPSGGALLCDGQGTGAVVKDAPGLKLGSEFTISAWVNMTAEPKDMKGPWPSIVSRFARGAFGFRLGFIRDDNVAFFKWGDGKNPHGYGIKSRKTSWERGWHHFVGVFSKTPAIYVDGELSDSGPVHGGFEDRGGDFNVGCDGFVGIVDKVALYSRALTPDEVQAIYLSSVAYAGGRNVRMVPVAAKTEAAPVLPAPANLIPGDGDFESGIDQRWEVNSATTDRSTSAHGSACARLEGGRDGATIETDDITVDVNKPYTFSAFLKGKGTAVLRIISVDPNNPYDGTWAKTQSFKLSDSWQRARLTLEPGWNWTNQWSSVADSGHKFRAAVRVGAGESCLVDALQFEEGTQARDYAPSQPASVSIVTGAPAKVFLSGEEVRLTFGVHAPDKGESLLRWQVKGYDGHVLCDQEEKVQLDDSGNGQVSVRPPIRSNGFFLVSAELRRGGETLVTASSTLCVTRPPREAPAAESFFGIQGPVSEERAEAMRRIGAKWMRMGVSWGGIERKKGEFHWDSQDERVKLLASKGIAIMGLISSTPAWARTEPPAGEWRVGSYPPKDMNDLASFMEQTAAHFRGKIDVWEIWNESWLDYFKINPACGKTKAQVFAEVLKAAYRGAKKGNPDCKVCVNPMGGKPTPFMEELLTYAPDAFDILNVHPYTGGVRIGCSRVITPEEFGMRDRMLDAARIMKEKARGQEVWNSEQGFTLDLDASPDGEFAKDYAKYMMRSLLLQRAAPIRRAFWFHTYDARMCNNRKGMWRHGLQPLPIVAAYAALTHALEGAKGVREVALPKVIPEPIYAYAFEKGAGGVVALWTEKPSPASPMLRFKPPGPVEVGDMMGNAAAGATSSEGRWSVPISDSPIFIMGDGAPWTALASAVDQGEILPQPVSISIGVRSATELTVTASNLTAGALRGEVKVKLIRKKDAKSLELRGAVEGLDPGKEVAVGLSMEAGFLDGAVSAEAAATIEGAERTVSAGRLLDFRDCRRAAGLKVDGNLDDWSAQPAKGDFAVSWSEGTLFLTCEMADAPAGRVWSSNLLRMGNGLRLRFDVPSREGYEELLVGESPSGPQVYRAHAWGEAEIGVLEKAQAAIRRQGGASTYEISIPFSNLPAGLARDGAVMEVAVAAIPDKKLPEPVCIVLRP